MLRANNRYWAGVHYEKAGDRERAKDEFRSLIEEFGSSKDVSVLKVVVKTRTSLERLEAAK